MGNVHLGTIGWSYSFWKGPFYLPKTASKDFLSYYASRFDTVEVDSTFYRIPTEKAVNQWSSQVTDGFLFSLKFPRLITHIRMLRNCERETSFFLARAHLLGNKLGALLLQFPPNFGIDRLPDLAAFLQKLPRSGRYVVEVRDKAFLNEDFYSLLQANNVALAWVDSPNMPTAKEVTSDFLYIRLEGDRKKVNGTLGKIETDSADRLRLWADKIKLMMGEIEVFGYFGKYYSGLPPHDIELLSGYLGLEKQSGLVVR
jgi:uncharacterized protein YecE (DUF72 family)